MPNGVVNGDGGGGILWSNSDVNRNGYDNSSLGSDESLGGALLTPIPWLRNNGLGGDEESSQEASQLLDSHHHHSANSDPLGDPNGMTTVGSSHPDVDHLVPERADGAVTQGELMRMEQEAGVIPMTTTSSEEAGGAGRTVAGQGAHDEEGAHYLDEGDNVPHARGPDVVGAVDMGRVGGQDVQIHIGSPPPETAKSQQHTDPNDAQTVLPTTSRQDEANTILDADVEAAASDSEDFEIVLKSTEDADADADAMLLDQSEGRRKSPPADAKEPDEQDGDIVLVDADGKTDDERDSKADASGENVGPDAVDSSTVT